jgi:hypothetical protein
MQLMMAAVGDAFGHQTSPRSRTLVATSGRIICLEYMRESTALPYNPFAAYLLQRAITTKLKA